MKLAYVTAACLVAVLLLSACVTPQAIPATTVSPTVAAAPATEVPTPAEAKVGAPEPITVEVVGWGSGQAPVYDALTKDNPNITVSERLMDYGELIPYLKTRFLANDAPDIVQIQPGAQVREFKDNLMSLDELIKSDSTIDMTKFVQPVLQTAYVDGNLYAIPQHPMVSGMLWYNADIFKELNLQPPTNYAELQHVAKACREAGYLPLAMNGADGWNRLILTEQLFAYIAPGKMEQAVAGQIPWNDPQLVEAMSYWKKLVDDGVLQDGVMGAGYGEAQGLFSQGKACMTMAGSWFKGGALKGIAPAENKGTPLPIAFPDITNSGAAWTPAISAGHVFAIAKSAKHPKEAWEVLKQIINLGDPLANYPVLVPVYDSGVASEVLKKASDADQSQKVKDFELGAWKMKTMLDEWVYPEVRDAIAEAASGVATGQVEPAAAMEQVQQVAERVRNQ